MCKKWPVRLISVLSRLLGISLMLTKNSKQFSLNFCYISFTVWPSSKNSEHKLCQTPKKDVNIARFKQARAKRSINKLSIIPLVTWLFLADKVSLTHRQVSMNKARFKRRILHAPNAIQTMHNEEAYLIIYCLNCIRCMQNSTFETGLSK